MAKADLIAEATELGLTLTGDETIAELETKIEDARAKRGDSQPTVPQSTANMAAERQQARLADFSWAVNVVKLNRAKAHVMQTQPLLKSHSKEFEAAVKTRYTNIGGLLIQDKPNRSGKRGTVVNLADNDED